MAQGQADIVEAVQRAVLAERGDVELVALARPRDHGLLVQIDGQLVAVERVGLVELSETEARRPIVVVDIGVLCRTWRSVAWKAWRSKGYSLLSNLI